MATIVSITYSPPSQDPRPVDHFHRDSFHRDSYGSARLITDRGIANDRKGKGGDRQLNVMSAEVLAGLQTEGFKTGPGEMGEQLVVAGMDVRCLKVGDR